MDKVENSAAAVRKSCGIGYREALKAKEKKTRSMFAPAWSLVCVGGPKHDEQLREVVAHLGTALDQSDYTMTR